MKINLHFVYKNLSSVWLILPIFFLQHNNIDNIQDIGIYAIGSLHEW